MDTTSICVDVVERFAFGVFGCALRRDFYQGNGHRLLLTHISCNYYLYERIFTLQFCLIGLLKALVNRLHKTMREMVVCDKIEYVTIDTHKCAQRFRLTHFSGLF